MQATVGFIGTGTMGAAMATNLARAGFGVRAYDRPAECVAALAADGVEAAASVAEAVKGAGFVITVLPDTPDVEEVALGDGGLVSLLHARPPRSAGDRQGPERRLPHRSAAQGPAHRG